MSKAPADRLDDPDESALGHATRIIHRICCLAGSADYITDV
jgi:hypothetical protein